MRERHFADYVDVVIKAFINHSVCFFFYQESCIFENLQSSEFVAHYMKCFLTCSRHNVVYPGIQQSLLNLGIILKEKQLPT